MWITKKQKQQLDSKVSCLENKISELEDSLFFSKKNNEKLEQKIKDFESQDEIGECSFFVNLSIFKPFSIERSINKNNKEITVYGYFCQDKVETWIFNCSREIHEKLVKQFKEYYSI